MQRARGHLERALAKVVAYVYTASLSCMIITETGMEWSDAGIVEAWNPESAFKEKMAA